MKFLMFYRSIALCLLISSFSFAEDTSSSIPPSPFQDTTLEVVPVSYKAPRKNILDSCRQNPPTTKEGILECIEEERASEKDFEMLLPSTWEISQNKQGYALFAEMPLTTEALPQECTLIKPNIRVAVVRDPKPIDEISLQEYKQQMQESLQKIYGERFRIESATLAPYKDKVALRIRSIFYHDQSGSEVDRICRARQGKPPRDKIEIAQDTLIFSNSNVHYRVELVSEIDGPYDINRLFEELRDVLYSIKIQGAPPPRKSEAARYTTWILGGLALLLVIVFPIYLNYRKHKRLLEELGGEDEAARSDDDPWGETQALKDSTPPAAEENLDSTAPSKSVYEDD